MRKARGNPMDIKQYVIVRDNCETFVIWAVNREDAIQEWRAAGYAGDPKPLRVFATGRKVAPEKGERHA